MKITADKNGSAYIGQTAMRGHLSQGMTLIEAIMYAALLSVLLAGFIRHAYSVHSNDLELTDEIKDAYR